MMEINVTRSYLFALAIVSAVSACSSHDSAPAAVAPTAQSAMGAPGVVPGAPGASANSGKVLQVQNGGGYTYAEVLTGGGQQVWIAGAQLDVKPGASVQWGDYAVMRNFEAKSLKRTFPEILFVNSWNAAGAAAVATGPHGDFPRPATPGAAPVSDSGVLKSVVNGGGYSYLEVDRGGKTVWVAAMQTPMKPGDKVQWQGDTEMSNFTAKSINRTFDKIIFASGVNVVK
jgi:hypothetical protein